MKIIILCMTLLPALAAAEIYQYRYSNGAIVYSDQVPNSVMSYGYSQLSTKQKASALIEKKLKSTANQDKKQELSTNVEW